MSKKKLIYRENLSELAGSELLAEDGVQTRMMSKPSRLSSVFRFIRKPSHWWVIALVCLLTLGAAGAGLKYVEETRRQNADSRQMATADEQNQSSSANAESVPATEAAMNFSPLYPAKEYVYAGSRIISIAASMFPFL